MLKGPVYDTMIAASVIDENRPKYSLDSLAKDYLNDEKYKHDLTDKAKELHGISDPMTNMHCCHMIWLSTMQSKTFYLH